MAGIAPERLAEVLRACWIWGRMRAWPSILLLLGACGARGGLVDPPVPDGSGDPPDGGGDPADLPLADSGADAACGEAPASSEAWIVEPIDSDAGWGNALVVDASGTVHFAHAGTKPSVRYSRGTPGAWQSETVDPDCGSVDERSLAVAADGAAWISYYCAAANEVRVASSASGAWTIERVDAEGLGHIGGYTSIALDARGNAFVGYYVRTGGDPLDGELRVASNETGSWARDIVDTSGTSGVDASIAIDAEGGVHVTHEDVHARDLRYAHREAGTWTVELADAGGAVGSDGCLALDPAGRPRVTYTDQVDWALRYAERDEEGWRIQTLDDAGRTGVRTSLAIDAGGVAFISYSSLDEPDLRFATDEDGGFRLETIDVGSAMPTATSIGLGPDGQPHIAFFDLSTGTLFLARREKRSKPSDPGC